jgi:hypothetical protein
VDTSLGGMRVPICVSAVLKRCEPTGLGAVYFNAVFSFSCRGRTVLDLSDQRVSYALFLEIHYPFQFALTWPAWRMEGARHQERRSSRRASRGDRAPVVELRAAGRSWRETAAALAVSVRTARRVYAQGVAKPSSRETGAGGAMKRVAGA